MVDFVVIGAGVAGMSASILLRDHGQVLLLAKGDLKDSNTAHAQGGIAVSLGADDSPQLHLRDTLEAGDGLCDAAAVEVLVREGPDCVRWLAALGARFDRAGGTFALGREAAHSRRRIVHAQGDATGAEVARALGQRLLNDPRVTIATRHLALDLLVEGGRVVGVRTLTPEGRVAGISAERVILASGGAGQLYAHTTNPKGATGDGIAMAYRAGVEVADLEFVQFHPTALYLPGTTVRFLISEAVRGEGATLVNRRGERFMPAYDARAELAPRDLVARAIATEIQSSGDACVYLDARGLGELFAARFPGIHKRCLESGIDPARDQIPVAPAAHYLMGGVKTDRWGRTSLPGLFACGEAARTGVHGANRLASNSLLEGLVFGRRAAFAAAGEAPGEAPGSAEPEAAARAGEALIREAPSADARPPIEELRAKLQDVMWEQVGLARNATGLSQALREIDGLRQRLGAPDPFDGGAVELSNLLTVARLATQAALDRRESRGAHYRRDFPPGPGRAQTEGHLVGTEVSSDE